MRVRHKTEPHYSEFWKPTGLKKYGHSETGPVSLRYRLGREAIIPVGVLT